MRELADTLSNKIETAVRQLPNITSKLGLVRSLCGDDLRGRIQQTALDSAVSAIGALLDARILNNRAHVGSASMPAPALPPVQDTAFPGAADDIKLTARPVNQKVKPNGKETAAPPVKRKVKPTAKAIAAPPPKRAKKQHVNTLRCNQIQSANRVPTGQQQH